MKRLFLCLILLFSISFALTPEEEKQLLKDVAEIKATLKVFMEQTEKRFEQIDKRFEQVDKRFEEVNHKIEMILVFMGILAGTFATITAVTIGFAIWDRRTMIRPFEDKFKKVEEELTENKAKMKDFLEALRKLAKRDEELAKFLRERNLL
ncbi:hypothetical protein IAE16_06335 [Hydrogenobacter sp. T-2]|uniref:hypothetical protein n=1 Tax=Pampinifervens diazotrophicum TaxID=1632018 RepID=UPI002B25F9CE|nr:hypothetical protein [Hydrogenobacter sp. T-2]WPM31435.1 hypothetical protein IAE16_06335 [Hydrogenobacter sp. T-2]